VVAVQDAGGLDGVVRAGGREGAGKDAPGGTGCAPRGAVHQHGGGRIGTEVVDAEVARHGGNVEKIALNEQVSGKIKYAIRQGHPYPFWESVERNGPHPRRLSRLSNTVDQQTGRLVSLVSSDIQNPVVRPQRRADRVPDSGAMALPKRDGPERVGNVENGDSGVAGCIEPVSFSEEPAITLRKLLRQGKFLDGKRGARVVKVVNGYRTSLLADSSCIGEKIGEMLHFCESPLFTGPEVPAALRF
jgi:hypothetical protein